MLTTPITTSSFHSRVLLLHANHLDKLNTQAQLQLPTPIISSLSSTDTPLSPGDAISQLLGIVSPWIDLCSPDPLIYSLSRQVLDLEIAYAAFCGFGNVIIPGPKLHYNQLHGEGIMQYALAIQEALGASNYLQIEIKLSIIDNGEFEKDDVEDSLAYRAREEYIGTSEGVKKNKMDEFGTWDAWNIIRTVCKYNSRLFVGKEKHQYFLVELLLAIFRVPFSFRLESQ